MKRFALCLSVLLVGCAGPTAKSTASPTPTPSRAQVLSVTGKFDFSEGGTALNGKGFSHDKQLSGGIAYPQNRNTAMLISIEPDEEEFSRWKDDDYRIQIQLWTIDRKDEMRPGTFTPENHGLIKVEMLDKKAKRSTSNDLSGGLTIDSLSEGRVRGYIDVKDKREGEFILKGPFEVKLKQGEHLE